tara:strand:- start:169 stop:453 length:285 start_codon:yes stop_codon:yes gene_type:complete
MMSVSEDAPLASLRLLDGLSINPRLLDGLSINPRLLDGLSFDPRLLDWLSIDPRLVAMWSMEEAARSIETFQGTKGEQQPARESVFFSRNGLVR